MLPEQVAGKPLPLPFSGEIALWWAVLKDAIAIAVRARRAESEKAEAEAVAWILDESMRLWGFEHVCALFGIDAEALRESVLRARATTSQGIPRNFRVATL